MNLRNGKNQKLGKVISLLLMFLAILSPWIITITYRHYIGSQQHQAVYATADTCSAPSVYHTKFPELQKEFASVHEVTEACLACHTERGKEIMQTAHWNWERESPMKGKGSQYFGKKNALNNFCIGTKSNEKTCTRCHIGYGYEDKDFDFQNQRNIDCLVCHDNTFTYKKAKGQAGFIDISENGPDLAYIAQNVCTPQRENCGKCHFFGGGGNNVKHGDLDKAMLNCSKDLDVHMAIDGNNMSCVNCHTAENHNILGRSYSTSSTNDNRVECATCHTDAPHNNQIIDNHQQKVSCQACHIPTYARANATKMTWDWTTAGRLDENGHPIHEEDADGNHTYLSIKGSFTWAKNVVPEYVWFNGTANHHLITDKIDTIPVQMNTFYGNYACNESKIIPVKVHRGKQIYDTEYNTLIQPKTYGEQKGDSAYWKDFDWQTANKAGMDYVGLPYSGKYDFVETEQYMQINHQVAPINQTVSCVECHSREGRLTGLNDFYLSGRDYNAVVDFIGKWLIILSVIGVSVHGLLRVYFCRKNKNTTTTH